VLAKVTSHCPVSWYLRSMACFAGRPWLLDWAPPASPCPVTGAASTRLGRTRPVTGGEMRSVGGSATTVLNADIAIRFAFPSIPFGASLA
jgi:hypothetical protein